MGFCKELLNNLKTNKAKVSLMREKDEMRKLDSDNLITYKKEEDNTDEFSMNDDDVTEWEWDQEDGHRTPCGEYRTVATYVFGQECPEESIDLGWKVEAVRGYVQNENDKMNDWLKNINSDKSNAFQMAFIDLI